MASRVVVGEEEEEDIIPVKNIWFVLKKKFLFEFIHIFRIETFFSDFFKYYTYFEYSFNKN